METTQIQAQGLPIMLNGKVAFTLPTTTAELTDIQKGWLVLAYKRETLFANLTRQELAIQAALKDVNTSADLTHVQTQLKAAKELAGALKAERTEFTNMLRDKLVVKAMEFEQRAEPLIKAAADHELNLRKQAAAKAAEINGKEMELAQLRAHINNEQARIAHQYRADLENIIHEGYKTALTTPVEPKKLKAYLKTLVKFMQETKLTTQAKFDLKLVSKEEAVKVFSAGTPYNGKADLEAAMVKLTERFAMYEQDLANSKAALKAAEQNKQANDFKQQQEHEIATATTTLMATAEVAAVAAPKVKQKYELVAENEPAWAVAVMGAFMAQFSEACAELRVKQWANLRIDQMGAALAALKGDGKLAANAHTQRLKFTLNEK